VIVLKVIAGLVVLVVIVTLLIPVAVAVRRMFSRRDPR